MIGLSSGRVLAESARRVWWEVSKTKSNLFSARAPPVRLHATPSRKGACSRRCLAYHFAKSKGRPVVAPTIRLGVCTQSKTRACQPRRRRRPMVAPTIRLGVCTQSKARACQPRRKAAPERQACAPKVKREPASPAAGGDQWSPLQSDWVCAPKVKREPASPAARRRRNVRRVHPKQRTSLFAPAAGGIRKAALIGVY